MNPYQQWVLTNSGAVDFLTMKRDYPLMVQIILDLQKRVRQLEARNTVPYYTKSTLPATR